jgi:hypothetical protein
MDTEDPVRGIVSEKLLEKLVQNGEVDFACVMVGVERFQMNAFRRRVSVSIAMRFVPVKLPNSRYGHYGQRRVEYTRMLPLRLSWRSFTHHHHQDNRNIINQH